MQAVTLGTTPAPLPATPKPNGANTELQSLLSSTASLREKLEVTIGKDGDVELDLRARLRSQTRAQLSLGGPEGATRAIASLSESISLRIHLEIQSDGTPGGLKDALGQLASGFKDALDSLSASFASDPSGGGASLVSTLRDAFSSLLDGLKPAFGSQALPVSQTREADETPETRTTEREARRESDEGSTGARSNAPDRAAASNDRPLDPRLIRLRSDLQNRFSQGLQVLLQTLEGRTPESLATTSSAALGPPAAGPPAAGAPAGDGLVTAAAPTPAQGSAPTQATTPARRAFEIQLSQRQEVRFRLLELRA